MEVWTRQRWVGLGESEKFATKGFALSKYEGIIQLLLLFHSRVRFYIQKNGHALPMMKMYMCDVCVVFERTSRVVNQFKICLLAFEWYCNCINSTFLKNEIKRKCRRGVFKRNFIFRLGLKYCLPSFVKFRFFYKV